MENKEFLLKELDYFKVTLEKIKLFDDIIEKIIARIDEFKVIIESQTEEQVEDDQTHMHRLAVIVEAFDHLQRPLYKGLCLLLVDDDIMSFLIDGDLPECKSEECKKE